MLISAKCLATLGTRDRSSVAISGSHAAQSRGFGIASPLGTCSQKDIFSMEVDGATMYLQFFIQLSWKPWLLPMLTFEGRWISTLTLLYLGLTDQFWSSKRSADRKSWNLARKIFLNFFSYLEKKCVDFQRIWEIYGNEVLAQRNSFGIGGAGPLSLARLACETVFTAL